MAKETKLQPAPLSGKSHLATMGTNKSLQKKHSTEMDALDAEYAAKRAALEHKQSQERQASPAPIIKPGKVTAQVRLPKNKGK